MDLNEKALELHKKLQGKISIENKSEILSDEDLSLVYSPGVAEPCKEISKNKRTVYDYTFKGNTIAVVSDGSAVLGLGDIGPEASLPVMEGKAALFKKFGEINAVPIVLDTHDTDEIVETVINIAPGFGGINLEDISAPRCFEIEKKLQEKLDIPVFHDDQHGTAIVTTAGLINALKLTKKKPEDVKVVISGAGAAGTAITEMLLSINIRNIIVCDINGIVSKDTTQKGEPGFSIAERTNSENINGDLSDALVDADVFIGVSAPNILTKDMVQLMADLPILFPMANAIPEIMPEDAIEAGARIVGTGRSDYPNQINNVLAFPGIFKGALRARAEKITNEMKIAAAYAISNTIPEDELTDEYIVPSVFNDKVAEEVAKAVEEAWVKDLKEGE